MAAPNLVEHYEDCLEDDEDYIIVDIDAETGLPILKDEYIYALHAFLDELNIMRSLQSLRNARFESPNHDGKSFRNFELKESDGVDGAGSISKLQKAADIEKEQTGLAAAPYARATAIREKNKRARSHTDPDFIKSDAVSDCTNTSWILRTGMISSRKESDFASCEKASTVDSVKVEFGDNDAGEIPNLDGVDVDKDEFPGNAKGRTSDSGDDADDGPQAQRGRRVDEVALAATMTAILVAYLWDMEYPSVWNINDLAG